MISSTHPHAHVRPTGVHRTRRRVNEIKSTATQRSLNTRIIATLGPQRHPSMFPANVEDAVLHVIHYDWWGNWQWRLKEARVMAV